MQMVRLVLKNSPTQAPQQRCTVQQDAVTCMKNMLHERRTRNSNCLLQATKGKGSISSADVVLHHSSSSASPPNQSSSRQNKPRRSPDPATIMHRQPLQKCPKPKSPGLPTAKTKPNPQAHLGCYPQGCRSSAFSIRQPPALELRSHNDHST